MTTQLRRILQCAWSALLIAGLLSGCATKAKVQAVDTVAKLKHHLEKHDEAQQKAIETLVRQAVEMHRDLLKARYGAKKEQVKADLYVKAEGKLQALREELAKSINAALAPVETRLNSEIEAERAKGAAGAERANTLRLQLATTLALTQREATKAEANIESKMGQKRSQLLQEIENEFKIPADLEKAVPQSELDALFAESRKTLKEHREGVEKSTDSLTAYLTMAQPWQLFLKGMVGDDLYQLIGPKLAEKTDALGAKVESSLSSIAAKLLGSAENKLNEVKVEE